MKIFSRIFIAVIIICGTILGILWFSSQLRNENEVTKIDKISPNQSRQVNSTQTEILPDSTKAADIEKPSLSEESHRIKENTESESETAQSILADEGFTPEEEAAFWNWLATRHIDYEALYTQVINSYPLENMLKAYGIEFSGANGTGTAICPFCGQNTFRTFVNAGTERRDYWHCNTCNRVPKTIITFFAKMENISENQAAEFIEGVWK